jgi:aspartate/methionine/tyrosine aminotransferase
MAPNPTLDKDASPRESIFITLTRKAAEHGSLNLAQGVFDHGPPAAVLDALARIGGGVEHQYAPSSGHPALREAIRSSIAEFENAVVHPETEITVTAGATEAIFCALTALLADGGEVVLLEPAYEQYRPVIEAAGGVVRAVSLPTPDDRLLPAQLAAVCGSRTKAIVVNSPWNPWGRALEDSEWAAIAAVSAKHGIVVVSDETYEHLMLDGATHRGVLGAISDPELRIKISSASKTLAVTGWRIGWAVAGPGLTRRLRARHQFVTFCPAVPLQLAVADVLVNGTFPAVRRENIDSLRTRVHSFAAALADTGLRTYLPTSTFYLIADTGTDAGEWCLRMLPDKGVAALPVGAFFAGAPPEESARLVRFALCKSAPTLTDAIARLRARTTVEVTS